MRILPLCLPTLLVLTCTFPVHAQEPAEEENTLAALQAFTIWIKDYKTGAIRLVHRLEPNQEELDRADKVMGDLARWNNLTAAKRLFEAATVNPKPPGRSTPTERLDFYADVQPWKVHGMARTHIASIEVAGLDEWLISKLSAKGLRSKNDNKDKRAADATIQILGQRKTPRAQLELLKASRALPPKLRLRAVDELSNNASIEVVDHFVKLLRDREDDMRIAALNAIGTAMAPHTDETQHDKIPADVAKKRDEVIEKMKQILTREKVWQVRAAAAQNLAAMKTKMSIPALIKGYSAELSRKKDPWAMDMRLHRLLRGMTGVSIPAGSARPWEEFWRKEKHRFRLATAKDTAKKNAGTARDGRYAKFFSLDLESDSVLFVIDFSGSMKETITLKTETTSAKSGVTIEKSQLIIDQVKKIIMSLPDKSVFNIIVFSDNVRVWRPDSRGYPKKVKLDDDTRDDLLGSFLDGLSPQGPTNIYGALDKALGFGGFGMKDKHYAVDFDTVYILSDGAPSYGEITDKDEIRKRVRETNRLKRMTINSITFGAKNDTDFLRLLAEENGGRHIHIE